RATYSDTGSIRAGEGGARRAGPTLRGISGALESPLHDRHVRITRRAAVVEAVRRLVAAGESPSPEQSPDRGMPPGRVSPNVDTLSSHGPGECTGTSKGRSRLHARRLRSLFPARTKGDDARAGGSPGRSGRSGAWHRRRSGGRSPDTG